MENTKSSQVLVGIQLVTAAFSKDGISKSHKNESQGFAFRGIDDVLNRMSKELVEANLVIIPRVISREVHERVNSRGNPLFYVVLTVDYTISSSLDGSSVVCTVVGEAMDSGDKATNKALSIAYKYMAFQLFSIPIAEDPDRTTHTLEPNKPPPVKTVSPNELEAIKNLATQVNITEEFICGLYKIEALSELPLSKVSEVTTNLQKKIKSKSKEKETV
jgi:hypothetical protein